MQIQRLDPKEYAGRRFTMRYTTGGYYHVTPEPEGFRLQYRTFDPPSKCPLTMCFSTNGWKILWHSAPLTAALCSALWKAP